MGDLHQLPDVREAEREASEWIARLHADDTSADDRSRFEAWRAAHPQRAEAYARLMGTWRQFEAAGPFVRAVSFAQSVSQPLMYRPPRRRWIHVAAVASILVALLGVMFLARAPSGTRFSAAVGEQLSISLPDGSTVQLNSDSVARVEYGPRARVIRLERGEAFFTVAHDVQRPFWVASGNSWVRAVGTAFSVYVRPSGVQVTVSEGTVRVGHLESGRASVPTAEARSGSAESILTAGQQADLRGATTSTREVTAEQLARAVSWRDGTVYFENQTLGEVVDEVGRYTTVRLVVEDERVRRRIVGGTFQANPQGAEALLTLLERGFGLIVRREGDRAFIEDGAAEDREPSVAAH